MRVLVRGTNVSLIKGQGVVAQFPDTGQSFILAREHAAKPGANYNPFFHDPRTGDVRTDIEHKWPMEALRDEIARDVMGKHNLSSHDALKMAEDVINGGHNQFNDEHHDKNHHLNPVFDKNGNLHPDYAHVTVTPEYQGHDVDTHDRRTKTEDGRQVNFFARAKEHEEFGQHAESGTNFAYRQMQAQAQELLGYVPSVLKKPHIEPGTMTNNHVYRHQSTGPGPGEHVTRPVQRMHNQTRGLPAADPFNILFGEGDSPKLPPAFWEKAGSGVPKKQKERLSEEYGIQDPELLDNMAGSAVGQLLIGQGRGRLESLIGDLSRRLDIGGKNAETYNTIHSHVQTNPEWKGRGAKKGRELAALLFTANQIGDDLSDFGSWDNVNEGVVENWAKIAPVVAEERGGGQPFDWGAAMPDEVHHSAQQPIEPGEDEHAMELHSLAGLAPRELEALSREPPADRIPIPVPQQAAPEPVAPPAPEQQFAYTPQPVPQMIYRSDDPASRILKAMEEIQLADARKSIEVSKHLPNYDSLSVNNTNDVSLMASKLGLTNTDVLGLYSATGDWHRVAKVFQVTPSVVGAVKVVFS